MRVDRLDHVVLTCASVEASVDFYVRALGMEAVTFGEGRRAVAFGAQKINLHPAGREYEPKATHPTPGSADLCFIVEAPVDAVLAHLEAVGVALEIGPLDRTGATGPIRSVYVRDPDGNLVEIGTYDTCA